ncbi:MAG: TlpA family protein disulfide reductase [Labilithrix sp.]|nr:TlpA family protein disulfide reductase [Labilithrix sp.]MCW5811672.1 TlpA family protein disulfide reductase [Labilithrix sp.]
MIKRLASTGAVLALLVAACGGEQATGAGATTAGAQSSDTGATASDFSARDIDGNTVKLSTYLGKQAILLNFWQTWCEPCVAEFPHLRKLYEANKDKGFILFGVAMDGPETVANVPAFAKRNQLNFSVLLDEDSHVAQIYNPKKSAPLSVLIDKSGKIAAIREGYNPGDEEYLARDVAKVLDASSAPK